MLIVVTRIINFSGEMYTGEKKRRFSKRPAILRLRNIKITYRSYGLIGQMK